MKLLRDPDDSPSDFRLQSALLVIASVLYIIPQVYGMEAADQGLGDWSTALISVSNLAVARPILWITLALFGITGALVFVRFLLQLGDGRGLTSSSRSLTHERRRPLPGAAPFADSSLHRPSLSRCFLRRSSGWRAAARGFRCSDATAQGSAATLLPAACGSACRGGA